MRSKVVSDLSIIFGFPITCGVELAVLAYLAIRVFHLPLSDFQTTIVCLVAAGIGILLGGGCVIYLATK